MQVNLKRDMVSCSFDCYEERKLSMVFCIIVADDFVSNMLYRYIFEVNVIFKTFFLKE